MTVRVRDYLHLCEQRELDAAQAFLSDDAVLVFPGGRRYTSVRAMVADAPSRYQSVTKRIALRDGLIVEQHVWNDLADLGHIPIEA